MLVSNEIERPITVNIRPRKSRHGGVSTQIVIKEKAGAAAAHASRAAERRPGPGSEAPAKRPAARDKKPAGGLLKKVFGARRA